MVGTNTLKNAEGSARDVKKPETRNTTYEVLPNSDENNCKYLIILFFGKKLVFFLRAVFPIQTRSILDTFLSH